MCEDEKQECSGNCCDKDKSILTIERVTNGFIVIDPDFGTQVFEIEEDCYDDEKGEVKAMIRLLWYITESFGVTGSRYSNHRVLIKDLPGDKYEDEEGGNIIFDEDSTIKEEE